MDSSISRRDFLQLGTGASAMLMVGSGVATLTGCSRQPDTANGYKVLRKDDLYFLGAIAPAILTTMGYPGSLKAEGRSRLLHKLDDIMLMLQHHTRKQLILMLDLMNSAPTRLAAGGPWHPWYEASLEDSERFLTSWRHSPLALKRMGYSGITKLLCLAWYSQPESYETSGYPGPPARAPLVSSVDV